MSSIYSLRAKGDDGPDLDLSDFDGDWDELFQNENPIELVTTSPGVSLDLFMLAGTLGVASERLAYSLLDWAGDRLVTRDVSLDGRRFLILLPGETLNVLDRDRSDFTVFRSNPDRVKNIRSFVFRTDAIPCSPSVFTIPESSGRLLLNESAADRLRGGGYRGLVLEPLRHAYAK